MVAGTQGLAYVISGRYQLRDQIDKQNKILVATDQVTLPVRDRSAGLSPEDVAAAEMMALASKDYEIVKMPR